MQRQAPFVVVTQRNSIAEASARTGSIALATKLARRLTAERVVGVYKDQSLVEGAHRNNRQTRAGSPRLLEQRRPDRQPSSASRAAPSQRSLIEIAVRDALDDEHLGTYQPKDAPHAPHT